MSAHINRGIGQPEVVVVRSSVVGNLVVSTWTEAGTDDSSFLNVGIGRIDGRPMTAADEALAQRVLDDINGLAASHGGREVVA
jgi:hypothetical protein